MYSYSVYSYSIIVAMIANSSGCQLLLQTNKDLEKHKNGKIRI